LNETSASEAVLSQPYLVGCDLHGRVVWISQYTQSELGAAENLSVGFFLRLRSGESYRVWPVIELTDTLVIGAQAFETTPARHAPAVILAMLPDTGERYLSTALFEGIPDGSDPEP